MIRHSRHHRIDSALVYGFAVLSIIALSHVERIIVNLEKKIAPHITQKQSVPFFNEEAFSKITVKARAYVVYDIVTGTVIAGKNEEVTLPLASVTKVMTAVTARTHFDKNKEITIQSKSIEGAYDLGLKNGQTFTLDELLKYMLVFSSNDGAQAVADGLGGRDSFIARMNSDAEKFGLAMNFTNPAGLDVDGALGGKGSALSVAKLLAIAHKKFPETFEATTKPRATVNSSTGKISGVPNTNQDVYNFSGIELSKTGFTDRAGGNLAIVVDIALGRPVAIVVLGSTREERFSDVTLLYKTLQKSIQR